MHSTIVTITANSDKAGLPIIWRLGRLTHVVTRILRARVSPELARVEIELQGTNQEQQLANVYLQELGLIPTPPGTIAKLESMPLPPEELVSRSNSITVRLDPVNALQRTSPILYRVGKDFDVVTNIQLAEFDLEQGGFLEVELSGALNEVQRAIAYLHTTGVHVNPYQRSVTNYSNL